MRGQCLLEVLTPNLASPKYVKRTETGFSLSHAETHRSVPKTFDVIQSPDVEGWS